VIEDAAKRISEFQTEQRKGRICYAPCGILFFIGVLIAAAVWSKGEEPFSTNVLAFPVMVVCIAVACSFFAGKCVHFCHVWSKNKNIIQSAFAPWEGKGVKAYWDAGGSEQHEHEHIKVTVPPGAPGAATVGSPQQHMMQVMEVVVPSGASPGQVLQVQAPTGQMLQAAIPQGANPGMSFRVQY